MDIALIKADGGEVDPSGDLLPRRPACVECHERQDNCDCRQPRAGALHAPNPQCGQRTAACSFLLLQFGQGMRLPCGRLSR